MATVSIKDAKKRLTQLARRVEADETITVTRNGKPAFDLVPHVQRRAGIDIHRLQSYKKARGIKRVVEFIPDDFDDPLPENFLIKPLR
jgi:prevent-host-death family protein